MLFLILGLSSLPVVVAQPDESMQTEQLLCWSGMTVTEHTTSGLNEENCVTVKLIWLKQSVDQKLGIR